MKLRPASEVEELRTRLAEAEETLHAIVFGEVDAVVVERQNGPQVYTLKSAAEPYRLLVEQMAQGALTVTLDGIILYCNESFAGMIGRRREHLVGSLLYEYATGGGAAAIGRLLSERSTMDLEMALRTQTGSVLDTIVSAVTLTTEADEVRCLVVTDLSDQELRHQHTAVVQAAEAAIYVLDPSLKIRTWNRGAELQTGLPGSRAIGLSERELWPEDSREELDRLIERCREDGAAVTVELQRRQVWGGFRTLVYTLTPLRNRDGVVTGYSVVAHDITERKRAEEHRQLLINELNHRVKNTLATVQGIAFQTFKKIGEPGREARELFESRLDALASAHNLLTRSNWEATWLDELAHETLKAGCTEEALIRIEGPRVVLKPKQAIMMVMALHELSTNAVKYGALSVGTGRVDLHWKTVDDGGQRRLKMIWREQNGPRVEAPARHGFGFRMIQHALAYELNGVVDMDFRPEGLVCTIEGVLP